MLFVDILKNLLNNATLLFSITLGYSYFAQRLTSHVYLRSVVPGLLFGLCGVLNMLSPFVVMPGVFVDSRTIIVAIAGTQGGFLSAVISASIISLFRLSIGGPGIVSALPGIWLNVILGSLFYRYRQYTPLKDLNSVLVLRFYLVLGVISTILAIVPFVLLPVGIREPTFQAVSLPMMIIFPLTGMIAGYLLYQQRRYFEMIADLSNERNMLRTLVNNIPDYIFIKDAQLRFILSNPAHTRAAHAASDNDLVGKTAVAYFSPELTAQYEADDRRVLAGESLLAQERQSVDEHGERIYVSTTKVPIRDLLGRITGVIGISRDITAEKLRAEQTQQLEVERQRTRMLKAFIQNASHDFRTPLSIISTKSYLLWRDPQGADRDERITMINAQITRLSRLMDDTLEMIELNEGVIEYEFQSINLNRVVQTVAAEYAPRVQENRQTLNLAIPEEMVEIEADERLIKLAIKHLVNNAVMYTLEGGSITVRLIPNLQGVSISVEDTGIGIAPEDQPHIFEPLYRADKARSHITGGTGLGLAITKKIVEGHHGDIRVISALDHGTILYLELPATQTNNPLFNRLAAAQGASSPSPH